MEQVHIIGVALAKQIKKSTSRAWAGRYPGRHNAILHITLPETRFFNSPYSIAC